MLKSARTSIKVPFGQRLSTGANNRRFKGTVKTMFFLAACTEHGGPIKPIAS